MKAKRKNRQSKAATAPESSLAPTVFDQIMVVSSGLCQEVGIAPAQVGTRSPIELPAWCRNILRQFSKTILKPLVKLRPQGAVDWRNYGRLITVMERIKAFYQYDVPRLVEEEFGDLTGEQWARIEPQLELDRCRALIVEALGRPVAEDEPLEKLVDELWERVVQGFELRKQIAFNHVAQQRPKIAALFYKGMAEGYGLLLNEQGQFCGDRGRTHIHLNLLASMVEVEKIRRTLPPTTRRQFYDSLTKPFKLTPKAYDWFSDVCDDIKFPLNNLGRKRRCPAPIL